MIAKTKFQLKDRDFEYIDECDDEGMYFLSNEKGSCMGQHSCREELRYEWYDNKYIGFAFCNLNIKGLNEILEYAENRLKLPKSQRSLIYLTNYKNIVLIKISNFWLESVFRKDVLTLLIRCGAVFNKNGIKHAFHAYYLTKKCLPALDLFLNGYTKLNFSMSPIVEEHCDIDDIEQDFDDNFQGFVDWTNEIGFKRLKDNYLIKG